MAVPYLNGGTAICSAARQSANGYMRRPSPDTRALTSMWLQRAYRGKINCNITANCIITTHLTATGLRCLINQINPSDKYEVHEDANGAVADGDDAAVSVLVMMSAVVLMKLFVTRSVSGGVPKSLRAGLHSSWGA